ELLGGEMTAVERGQRADADGDRARTGGASGAAAPVGYRERDVSAVAGDELVLHLERDRQREAGRISARLEGGGDVEQAEHEAQLVLDGGALLEEQHVVDRGG